MRKYLSLLSALVLSFSLCACQNADTSPSSSENQNNSTEHTSSGGNNSTTEAHTEASASVTATQSYTEEERQVQEEFGRYLDELFCTMISESDTITVHYLMQRPEDFGIDSYPISFGELIIDKEEYAKEITDELNALSSYSYDALTTDQQLTYDVVAYYLNTTLDYIPYYYYQEPLSTSSGIHALLPIYFAEYGLYREQDVLDYLALLKEVRPYFEQILAFERERISLGIFMEDAVLDSVISQCNAIYGDALDHFYLNDIFEEQLAQVTGLSEEQQQTYLEEHQNLILTEFAPAYQFLINELTAFKGKGGKSGGAITYPEGASYVEVYSRYSICSQRSLEEIKDTLESSNIRLLTQIQTLATLHPELYDQFVSFSQPTEDPEGILEHLISYFSEYFPSLGDCSYSVSYVHKSLEGSMNPAFYMIPSLDGYLTNNSIYINRSKIEGNGLFTTLAHEGYPGHMLQNTYFRSSESHPIRALFSFLSYSEGWATYVEHSSYGAMEAVSGNLAKMLAANTQYSLNALALVDIGINYDGWSFQDTCNYFNTNFGISDAEQVRMYYNIFVSDPFSYVPYALGCIEVTELLESEQERLGDNFDLLGFHTKFLTIGPAPMEIVKKYIALLS